MVRILTFSSSGWIYLYIYVTDTDECEDEEIWGMHECENGYGDYKCKCKEGFVQQNKHKCKSIIKWWIWL